MITKFKLYELNDHNPTIGDYVICQDLSPVTNDSYGEIGQIIDINTNFSANYPYIVSFDFDDAKLDSLKDFIAVGTDDGFLFSLDEIKYCSKNKKDLELMLSAEKFNL